MGERRTTWRDIAGDLRAAIARGEHRPGARLPSRAQLTERYSVAPQTVVNALNALRSEGLVTAVTGSGFYVRARPPVMRMTRARLSRAERAAGRGTFTTDAHAAGWAARVSVTIRTEPADDTVAAALDLTPGTEVLVRDRVMLADDEPVQLATSFLPRAVTTGTAIEEDNTGPGGLYARLEEAGHRLTHFVETVRFGQTDQAEATRLAVPAGTTVYRIRRVAHTAAGPVELNVITALAERYELTYELPAE